MRENMDQNNSEYRHFHAVNDKFGNISNSRSGNHDNIVIWN